MNKLKPCPFCRAEVPADYIHVSYIEKHDTWLVSHYCKHDENDLGVCISVYGKTRAEAIERWNNRAEV